MHLSSGETDFFRHQVLTVLPLGPYVRVRKLAEQHVACHMSFAEDWTGLQRGSPGGIRDQGGPPPSEPPVQGKTTPAPPDPILLQVGSHPSCPTVTAQLSPISEELSHSLLPAPRNK